MVRRFTLAGLLLWVALVALLLAIVVPIYRWRNRSPLSGTVVSVAASADGSTFAALLGDGTILVWDGSGWRKTSIGTERVVSEIARLALSSDGKQPRRK